MKKIPFIKYTKVWMVISIATVILALAAIFSWGLKYGIDFTSGSLMEMSFSKNRPTSDQVQKVFESQGVKDAMVQGSGTDRYLIRSKFLSEDEHQKLLGKVRDTFSAGGNEIREESFQTIGSVVSSQLKKKAVWAIILVNLAIILYVAYAFRKASRPVPSWKYGILAIVALCHDILLVVGVFAVLGHFMGIEIQTDFVVALLTVLGYSVTDTIVVYDRIRENVVRHSANDFATTVNNGLNETLMRSINTTLTVLLPLLALFYLGGSTIHNFALALLIGMASGAYSSIFIASPLLVIVERWQRRRAARA